MKKVTEGQQSAYPIRGWEFRAWGHRAPHCQNSVLF